MQSCMRGFLIKEEWSTVSSECWYMNCHPVPGDSRAFSPGRREENSTFHHSPLVTLEAAHTPPAVLLLYKPALPARAGFAFAHTHNCTGSQAASSDIHSNQAGCRKSALKTFNWGISPLFWIFNHQNMLYLIIPHGWNAQCSNRTSGWFLMIEHATKQPEHPRGASQTVIHTLHSITPPETPFTNQDAHGCPLHSLVIAFLGTNHSFMWALRCNLMFYAIKNGMEKRICSQQQHTGIAMG